MLLASGLETGVLWQAASAGIATVGVWALGRELDPDHSLSALIGAVASIPMWLVIGVPNLVEIFTIVLAGRVLLRPTGKPPLLLDSVLLAGTGVLAGQTNHGWILALALAFAISRDRTLPGPESKYERLTALVVAAGATGLAVRSGRDVITGDAISSILANTDSTYPLTVAIVVAALGFIAAVSTRVEHPTTIADYTHEALDGRRLQSARRITLFGSLIAVIVAPGPGLVATSALWLAWIGVVVRRLSVRNA